MEVKTFAHDIVDGWSAPFPDWDSEWTLVVVFGAPEYRDDQLGLKEIVEAYPSSHVVGCSTAGEIHGRVIRDRSLAVAIARFDATRVASTWTSIDQATQSFAAGSAIGRNLMADDLKAVIVLSEGVGINGTDLAKGLTRTLPEQVVVTGGLAGDGDRLETTWILADGVLHTGAVAAVGLYGDSIDVKYGSKGGWDIFGPERMVTHSIGNVLYELDGRPALDLYTEYLGDLAESLPASGLLFPLSIRQHGDTKQLVRTILGVDHADRSLTFAGDVPTGTYARLMQANFDRLIDGAGEAALQTGIESGSQPTLSLAISCVGRRLLLGDRTEEEVEATLDVLPAGVHQIGFYSYGELSPSGVGTCELQNQTMTLTTISERRDG
jgi:hypothetical protein